jgi:hypothetical protein
MSGNEIETADVMVFRWTSTVAVPASQVSDVTLPATINGNIETAASEDVYRFSTTSAGSIKLAFSTCASSLGTVSWKLLNAAGATVASNASSCATTTVPSVPAGSYRVSVTGPSGLVVPAGLATRPARR